MKSWLTISSLGRKLMMSLGQGEPIYTFTDQNIPQFIKEAGYGGRVGKNIPEFISSLCTENETILENILKSNSRDNCKLKQEHK